MDQSFENAVTVFYLNPENCRFYMTEQKILMCSIPTLSFDARVFLAKAFPFEKNEEYLSVLNEEKQEVGMIRDLAVFPEETAELVRSELEKRYFAPKIKKIVKVNERFGFSYWEVETDFGRLSFTVKDIQRSLIRVSEERLFVVDTDGCRYEIENVNELDRKSYSKIQLYL